MQILSNNDCLLNENTSSNFIEKMDKKKNNIMNALQTFQQKSKLKK